MLLGTETHGRGRARHRGTYAQHFPTIPPGQMSNRSSQACACGGGSGGTGNHRPNNRRLTLSHRKCPQPAHACLARFRPDGPLTRDPEIMRPVPYPRTIPDRGFSQNLLTVCAVTPRRFLRQVGIRNWYPLLASQTSNQDKGRGPRSYAVDSPEPCLNLAIRTFAEECFVRVTKSGRHRT